MNGTGIVLKRCGEKYAVELYIRGNMSGISRIFDSEDDARKEVKRIMDGLVLPLGSFDDQCDLANT